MFAFTAIWATNIHDAVPGNTEPVMGAKYHTVRLEKGLGFVLLSTGSLHVLKLVGSGFSPLLAQVVPRLANVAPYLAHIAPMSFYTVSTRCLRVQFVVEEKGG